MSRGTGLFIEPKGDLRTVIEDWKSLVQRRVPDQPLCSHPPHCTLIHTQLWPRCLRADDLVAAASSVPRHMIRISRTHVFEADPGCDGGHTMVFLVERNEWTYRLQSALGKAIEHCVDGGGLAGRAGGERKPEESESLRRFGYSFVGDHWMPHFTIASLRTQVDHPLIGQFRELSSSLSMVVDTVSLWSVDGDNHERRMSLHLGAG